MADIFISEYNNYPVVSAYIDGKLQFLSIVRENLLGNVYLCRVDNIVNNLLSAFVRFEDGQIGYVPQKSILPCCVVNRKISSGKEIRQGDEIILQIETEALKLKKPKLSSYISVSGRYSVVTLGRKGVGASLKLESALREKLIDAVKSHYNELLSNTNDILASAGFGIIIRTEAAELPSEEALEFILSDILKCIDELEQILKEGRQRSLFYCIKKNRSDDVEEHIQKAVNFLKSQGIDSYNVINDSVIYSLRQDIEKLRQNKIWLKSGGFLIIEQLESFNAIDVNSGKAVDRKKDTFQAINYEAAKEIFRQIRLRNLSGMILIDFINSKDKEESEKLCEYVRKLSAKEPVHTEFIDITGLGIIELTRNKNDKTLKEVLENIINTVDNA